MKKSFRFSSTIPALLAALLMGWAAGAAVADGVLIVGDSMMKSVSRALKKECARRKIPCEDFTSIGSGLVRMDLFDWQAKVQKLMAEHKPDTVVVMMGANDDQTLRGTSGTFDFGTPQWREEYGRRCGKLMDAMISGGARKVVWFGLPCMREKKLNEDAVVISRIIKQQAAARPEVEFISTYKLFSKKNKYSGYIIQKNGMPLDVRADDGIHLNHNGADYLIKRTESHIFGVK